MRSTDKFRYFNRKLAFESESVAHLHNQAVQEASIPLQWHQSFMQSKGVIVKSNDYICHLCDERI